MTLRRRISVTRERRKARRQKAREDAERRRQAQKKMQERVERAYALTPQELGERISAGELADKKVRRWARRVSHRDASSLARDVAELSDRDRQLLSLVLDGWTTYEIASVFFKAWSSVTRDVRRIFEGLAAKEEG
jgi:DNA-binding NarL/FixJ family response regulator